MEKASETVGTMTDMDHLDALMGDIDYFEKLKFGHTSKVIPILN